MEVNLVPGTVEMDSMEEKIDYDATNIEEVDVQLQSEPAMTVQPERAMMVQPIESREVNLAWI